MFKSGSTSLVRNLNQQHVLNLVRMHPGISAAEISRITRLRISTISYTLRALKEEGFIQEMGQGQSSFQGGKPATLWDLRPSYGYIIGMELIPHELRLVLLDFSTKVLFQHIYPAKLSDGADTLSKEVIAVIHRVIAEHNLSAEDMLGVGIGFPGLVNNHDGFIHYSYTFNLHEIPFRQHIQQHFKFPIELSNDANAGALGIKWLSRSEHMVPNILYVTINQNFRGMGIGLILNHELYEGAHGCAGEINHFMPLAVRRRIVNLAQNKFENTDGFLKILNEHQPGEIPVSDIVDYAEHGDRAAQYILRQIAKIIGKELARIVDLFDPNIVVIGGDICGAQKFTEKIIQERVLGMGTTIAKDNLSVQFSPFGIYSVAMGSTALISQRIFRA